MLLGKWKWVNGRLKKLKSKHCGKCCKARKICSTNVNHRRFLYTNFFTINSIYIMQHPSLKMNQKRNKKTKRELKLVLDKGLEVIFLISEGLIMSLLQINFVVTWQATWLKSKLLFLWLTLFHFHAKAFTHAAKAKPNNTYR